MPLEIVKDVGVPIAELYGADLTLVRPDQHVAWRGQHWAKGTLRHVVGFGDGPPR